MSLKLLSQDLIFYGSLDVLQRAIAVLLVPVYTRVLTQRDYGDLDLLITASSALMVFVDLQFASGFSRLYLEHYRAGRGPAFAGSSVVLRTVVGVLAAVLLVAAGLAGLLEVPFIPSFQSNRAAWVLVALNIPLTLAYDILLLQARMLRMRTWFGLGAVGNVGLSSLLCVIFTVVVPLGIVGVVLGQFVGKLVATILLLIGARREVAVRLEMGIIREILKYTLPLVPGWWLAFSTAYVGRFFVYGARGAEENAILAISTKLVGIIGLFSVSFRIAWQPLAMSYINDARGPEFYVQSLRVYIAGALFSMFAMTALAGPIVTLLAPSSYQSAALYVPLLAVATVLGELEFNLQLGNQIARRTWWMSFGAFFAFVTNILLLAGLTSSLGIFAVGIGLLGSFVVRTAVTYVSAQRNWRINYDRRALVIFAAGCVLLLAMSLVPRRTTAVSAAVLGATAVLGIVLPWMALAAPERFALRALVSSRLSRVSAGRLRSP